MITNEELIKVLKKRAGMIPEEDLKLLLNNIEVIPQEIRENIVASDSFEEDVSSIYAKYTPELDDLQKEFSKTIEEYKRAQIKDIQMTVSENEALEKNSDQSQAEDMIQKI